MIGLSILFLGIDLNAATNSVKLIQEVKVCGYTIKIFEKEEAGIDTLQFSRLDKIEFKRTKFSKYTVGLAYEDSPGNKLVPPGKDINGDGVSDVVITEWTRGAHCCSLFHVFSLGSVVNEIAVIDAQHSDESEFVDAHHNGILDFSTRDWTFAYWKRSFAESPAPAIFLKWDKTRYILDADQMRRPPLGAIELEDEALKIKVDSQWSDEWRECLPPSSMWATMLDLIYSGNDYQAWRFAELAWNPSCPGIAQFLKDFKLQLAQSPYWTEIKEMNNTNPKGK